MLSGCLSAIVLKSFQDSDKEEECMKKFLGPRDRSILTENEELAILEAFQSAEEYLDMRVEEEDFYFETEE